MVSRVGLNDVVNLSQLSKATFSQSHGHSAPRKEIDIYLRYAYSLNKLKKEINDPNSLFYFMHFENKLAGYSKLSINTSYPLIEANPLAKLDRIYIEEIFLDKKLGQTLLDFNLAIARQNNQQGIWLYTWVENHRAIKFYIKNDFEIIDHKDFKISNNHSNPNFIMYKNL